MPGPDAPCNEATALYELRLHHYVQGLAQAGSPYAHHSLGSCLGVRSKAYAQVRGFPKRSGGEDFYLLNKLAKVGPVIATRGQPVELQARRSGRVPFGTGPAVAKIMAASQPLALPLFDHPECFNALRALLSLVATLRVPDTQNLAPALAAAGLEAPLAAASASALAHMNLAGGLQHCRRQSTSAAQFERQFHQWFDAFRTLKFIHLLRDSGWPMLSFNALRARPEPSTILTNKLPLLTLLPTTDPIFSASDHP